MLGMASGATISAKRMAENQSSRPRVIIVNQYYDPEPSYKGQLFAEAIRDSGYDVEVVTGFPHYPGGKLYDGYRIRPMKRTESNGIRITRLALYPSHSGSRIGRIVNYVSFMLSVFIYLSFVARRASLVYAYSPPLTVGVAAAASRLFRRRTPVIVDIHDLWPDTLPASGMISNPRILGVIGRVAGWMYRRVQFIILHTQGFRKKLLERGVPAERMQAVIGWTNEYPLPETRPEGTDRLAALPGLKLLYAGNMGPAQALDSVIDAAEILQQRCKTDLVSFCFMGGGVSREALEKRVAERELGNVFFFLRVPPGQVGHFLNVADALLVHLRKDPLFEITLPSKTQAYMYAGKPIVMSVQGEAAELIAQARCGLTATPQSPESLADAVTTLAQMPDHERRAMGERGRAHYLEHLQMATGIAKFDRIFSNVINKVDVKTWNSP